MEPWTEQPFATPASPKKKRRLTVGRVLAIGTLGVVIALLPFVALVRSAVMLYAQRGLPTWLAIAAALGITAGILTAYAGLASLLFTGKVHLGAAFKWIAIPLVTLYAGYTLVYLSSENAKSEEVRAYYRTLHPILRTAVATLILADRDLVITDMSRSPEQYRAMGLPTAEASAHYTQATGYVHAIDLRTIHRPAWRNWLVRSYFRLMGFQTLRHVGTADHLHVSLPVR